MVRNIIAVIIGYTVFALSSVLLFQLTGQAPHQDAPLQFKIITIFYGLFFSVAAGYVAQLIARQTKLTMNYILAALIFLLAAMSIIFSKDTSHWTQLFAMLIFAPASMIGGYLRSRRSKMG
jgi:peptidoglycan/LPS O-acetylase OafA/YrhL